MAENDSIFNADSKAIARISADYSRSVRNVILRLCLRMSSGMVPESEICRELSLIDRDTTHPMQALWNEMCHVCSSVGSVTDDRDGVPILTCTFPEGDVSFTNKVLGVRRRFSLDSGEMENMYYVSDRRFISIVVSGLQNAQYIAEDENGDYLYLGSEVHGHIFQKYLPGQFFTFSGKYYEVLRVTNEGKVIVRRAADHINGRPAYRQCRIYTITNAVDSTVMGESRCKGAVSIRRQYADFYVQTPAYWDMDGYNNFKTGKRVEISGIPVRYYRNKAIIKMDINLPNADETVMATLALLTNEVLRTVLADNACYASVVTAHQMPEPVTYSLRGENGIELDEKSIYIIEDSQLDIGILDAVERNLDRIFEIICDYLNWNDEAIEKSKNPPPPEPDVEYTIPEGSQPQGKQPKTKLGRFIKKIIDKLFGRFKKKKPISPQQPEAPVQPETEIEQPAEPEQPSQPEETIDSAQQNTEVKDQVSPENEQPENVQPDNNDDHGDEINASETFILHDDAPKATLEFEEEELVKPMQSIERRPYHERYYLLYCGCDGAHRLDTNGVKSLLTELGFAEGALRMARDGKDIAAQIERNFVPGKPGSHYCDFCGDELVGTEYDTLADGRERCRNCSRTAIRSREKFVQLYENVTSNMLTLFGVKIEVPVTIQMVNAKKLHSKLGKSFTPTQRVDARTLGFAMKRGNEYTIMLENGSPRLMSAMTMVHELTHIWQYTNWDSDEILRLYGHEQETEIYEGMAKWIEIQYAYLIGETAAAKREEIITRCRDDVYGHGFVKYAKKYPLKISGGGSIKTPFDNPHKPL
jgi:hypothetical protein